MVLCCTLQCRVHELLASNLHLSSLLHTVAKLACKPVLLAPRTRRLSALDRIPVEIPASYLRALTTLRMTLGPDGLQSPSG